MFSRMALRLHHRTLTKTYNVSEIVASHRSLHLTCKFRHTDLKKSHILGISKHKPILAVSFIRHASSGDDKIPEEILPFSIPDPPTPPPVEVMDIIQAVGEPSIQTLGMGGYTPVGLVQSALEWLHVTGHIPWWGAIVIGTICVRTLLFPLVIKAQRNAAAMHNYLPQIQHIQSKMSEAREMGDDYESARYGQELLAFMKEKNIGPMKTMLIPLAQTPFFISFFLGLRGMANAPVDSMREGGLWWFKDLTVPDPYYTLPFVASATMYLIIARGVDGFKANTVGAGSIEYIVKAVPFIMFPIMLNFQGAVVCYWVSTNLISLLQAAVLKIPSVRAYFNIPILIKHEQRKMPPKKGFVAGFKDSMSNMKKAKEMSDRGFADHLEFERAGKGAVPKTFKYDPTRQAASSTARFAKKLN